MKLNTCEICSKKLYKFYEINSFPINIYREKKKYHKNKKLKLFLCKFCNHISIPKINSQNNLYKSYKKKKFLTKYKNLNKINDKQLFLEISKEKPIFSKKLKIDHMSILNNEYLKINKKYKKIFINDCISNIYKIKKFFKKISHSLDKKGEIEIFHHYGPGVIKNLNIDRVYFEHINNFSYKSLKILAKKYGLKIKSFILFEKKNFFKAILVKRNIILKNKILINYKFDIIKKKNITTFINNINKIKFKLKSDIKQISENYNENHIYGYGASIGSVALIKFLDLEQYIDKLIDDYTDLKNIYLGKKNLKIQKQLTIKDKNSMIINLAPRYKVKIRQSILKKKIKKITYIEPLPNYYLIKKAY